MEILYHHAVKRFIHGLEKATQSKVVRGIDLIETYGPRIGMPHVKKVSPLLYELRIRGRQEVRIFFCIEGNQAILIHGFVKKTQQTPQREIDTAQRRLGD